MKVCTKCGKSDGGFYVRIDTESQSSWCRKCIKATSNTKKITAWRHRKKARMVEYKGGKCSRCGYNRSIHALQFHHRDANMKSFTIASAAKWTWEHLRKELDKCDLLCANCHAEVEYN